MEAKVTAQVARRIQRDWLIEDLLEDLFRSWGSILTGDESEEEKESKVYRFCLLVAHDLLTPFISGDGGPYCKHVCNGIFEVTAVDEWVRKAKNAIDEFGRTKEERDMVKTILLEKLIRKGMEPVTFGYILQEVGEPTRLFGTKRFNDMVPLPERE